MLLAEARTFRTIFRRTLSLILLNLNFRRVLNTSKRRILLGNNDTCSSIFLQKISKHWYTGPWNE